MKFVYIFTIVALCFVSFHPAYSSDVNILHKIDVFISGKDGYHTFRIPALIKTTQGTLIAFAEGRVNGMDDFGNIDIVLKRSLDNGKSWQQLQLVQDAGNWQYGNPCPIVDQNSGRVFLLFCGSHNSEQSIIAGEGTRDIYMSYSDNDGLSWSDRQNISAMVKKENWRWYATGPCSGIQIRSGKYKGRLVAPANHSYHDEADEWEFRTHSLFSDDQGVTWQIGASSEAGGNESQIAEVTDDLLIQDVRMQTHRKGLRAVRFSHDGGLTWSSIMHDENRPCPKCQGSIISILSHDDNKMNRLIVSNPAGGGRTGMALRLSTDGSKSWKEKLVIEPGPSAYSDLTLIENNHIGCLFEMGAISPYEKITFVTVPLDLLGDEKVINHIK
ncbi:exo-alpha-sialidase [candidate division KSB1 bacterium]|nr:exo-alpha-sialidase [candidate division KSB1 bacterium]